MYIRQERPEDYKKIYELVKKAFETAAVKDGDEQDYVTELRKSGRYIPELALVAAEGDLLIGHIMLTETELVSEKDRFRELLLSPLCVALEYRRRGAGGVLIQESLRLAKEKGYSAVFLCGDPEYYMRHGFRKAADFGIINAGEISQEHVMAYELLPGALKNRKGTIRIE
jgi:predicted N-acetyltransferase YhbS